MNTTFVDLEECTELRLSLQAKPPAMIHGTAFLLTLFLVVAITWSAHTEAELVVRAPGRVRAASQTQKVFTPADLELLGVVAEVCVQEGERVSAGDVLLRLNDELLSNRMATIKRSLATHREELSRLERLDILNSQTYFASVEKVRAELRSARRQISALRDKRASEIRAAQIHCDAALADLNRVKQLAKRKVASEKAFADAGSRYHQALESIEQAKMPIEQGRIEVLERELTFLQRAHELKQAEVEAKQIERRHQLEAAKRELFSLEVKQRTATLTAPSDGVVVKGRVSSGDVLSPGSVVFEISDNELLRFEAMVSSDDVGEVEVGMPVRVRLDAYDHQEYGTVSGRVTYVSPDAQLLSTHKDLAFLIRIELESQAVGHGKLKLGMSGSADLIVGREPLFALLATKFRHAVSLN